MLNEEKPLNFIEEIIEEDLRNDTHDGRVLTRFPPEPNGYLHIGHAKSICLNFGLAQKYNGKTNLRFDDTNPVTEDTEYVDSIKQDIQWLGFQWGIVQWYCCSFLEKERKKSSLRMFEIMDRAMVLFFFFSAKKKQKTRRFVCST